MYSKKLVFTAACMGMLLFGIVLISLGSILPNLTLKYGLDEISTGSLASILPFGILAGSVVFGPIVDRYGYKNLLIVCALLVFVGLEGIAYANGFLVLQVSIFLIGFGGGVINGGTNALVSDISSEGKGANLSLLGVFFGIGALGMPAILGLLSKTFTYDAIVAGVGAAVLLPVIFFVAIKFPVPKQPQGVSAKKSFGLFKDATLVIFGFVLFFESGMEGIVNNWTTTYLQNDLSVNPENALYALSYFVLGMTVARLLLGGILKKMPSYLVLFACLSLAFIGSIVMHFASSYGAAIAGLVILGFGFAAGFPVVLGYVGELYAQLSGTAFSIVLVIGLIGNMLLNYSMGLVAHAYGIKQFPIILIISVILMSILLWSVLSRVKNKIKI